MRPLVPLAISFMLGIFVSERAGAGYVPVTALLVLSVIPVLIAIRRKWPLRTSLIVPPFFFLGALFILPVASPDLPPGHIRNFIGEDHGPLGLRVEGVVSSLPEVRDGQVRLHVDALCVDNGLESAPDNLAPLAHPAPIVTLAGSMRPVSGRILLTVEGPLDGLKRGDRILFMATLKTPRNFGNPGGFDYEWWLGRKHIYVTGYVKEGFIIKTGEGRGPLRHIETWRDRIRALIDSAGLENGGILKALIIGERSGIPEDTREVFRRAGAAHILAISGLHVGLVAFFAYAALLWLLKRSEHFMLAINVKKLAVILAMVPVLLYALIAGFSVSTQRAVIMVGALVITMLIDREKNLYNTLALAALAILLVSPGSLWEASFQLTFAAVLAIIYLVPGVRAYFEKEEEDETAPPSSLVWRRRLFEKPKMIFLVTVAAIVGTAPILAFHFNMVSFAGLVTNLFVVPFVGFVAVPLGLLSAFVLPLCEGLSLFMLNVSDAVIGATLWALKFFSGLTFASVWVSIPTVFEIILFYLLIVCATGTSKGPPRLFAYAVPALVFVIFLDLGYWHARGLWDRDMRVSFISVGQGDAALVEFPPDRWGRRQTMLIDGGDVYRSGFDTGRMVVAPFLWKKRIKTVDHIVLSHPQKDHMGGLGFIAANFNPQEFWWNGEGGSGGEGGEGVKGGEGGGGGLGRLEEALEASGAKVLIVSAATEKRVINGVEVEFLRPAPDAPPLDTNNNSLVIRLSYGTRSFLFTGDMGEEAEGLLRGRDISADVLKVPHHGSRHSSTGEFLDAVSPGLAVVSAGWMNAFGFPNEDTLRRYSARWIRVLRTDTHGAVTVETDGDEIRVRTHLTEAGS